MSAALWGMFAVAYIGAVTLAVLVPPRRRRRR